MTKLTGLPRSSFYYSETHPKQDKHKEERELVQQIYHANKGRYGYRRITLEFRNRGFSTNHKVIQKLMHEEHIVCKVRQHKYDSYKGQIGKVAQENGLDIIVIQVQFFCEWETFQENLMC